MSASMLKENHSSKTTCVLPKPQPPVYVEACTALDISMEDDFVTVEIPPESGTVQENPINYVTGGISPCIPGNKISNVKIYKCIDHVPTSFNHLGQHKYNIEQRSGRQEESGITSQQNELSRPEPLSSNAIKRQLVLLDEKKNRTLLTSSAVPVAKKKIFSVSKKI